MVQSSRPDDGRPDPDALLAAFRRESAGRLKVFVGAAPGVGKTYAMLLGARRLKEEGVDVVIGLVETHGRAETSALVEGLEVLPRRMVEYHGRTIAEFDLDAALARKPALIVVDELAHTNAPESRHPKRWQDVQELLAAGIDVWTALNIQHLESLADVVSRISGVVVRETVPDRVLQEASDVVLVDITPDELIQRLNEGKVYVPETARRATQNFFTPGNLTALRESAQRQFAQGGQIAGGEEILGRSPRRLRHIDLALVQPLNKLVRREVDQDDVVRFLQDAVGNSLAHGDAGNARNNVGKALEMLDVERRPHVHAGREKLLDVLPALGMTAVRRIAVGQFVDDDQLGLARQRPV